MARLRRQPRLLSDIKETDTKPSILRTRVRKLFGRRSRGQRAQHYHHFARHVKASSDDEVGTFTGPPEGLNCSAAFLTTTAMAILALCYVFSPDTALRVLLLAELLLCEFPLFFGNWIVAIPIALPMKVQSRTEVVLSLAMLSWIGQCDWIYAWQVVRQWYVGGKDLARSCDMQQSSKGGQVCFEAGPGEW